MAKKRRKSKSIEITMTDVGMTLVGGLGALALNKFVNKALENKPEMLSKVGKIFPIAKLGLGGMMAFNKDLDRNFRFAGIGVAGAGGIELGATYATEYISIGTMDGDVFEVMGIGQASDMLSLPIVPSDKIEVEDGDLFESELMGAYDDDDDEDILY